jgi:hypothetical protein
MTKKLIYEVIGHGAGDGHEIYYGAEATREEAEAELTRARERVAAAGGKVNRYEVREKDVTGAFEPPPAPAPRERYHQVLERKPSKPGCWDLTDVTIFEGSRVVVRYERNYPGIAPFEVFRQSGRDYALISRRYMGTDVLDLATGEVIASEDRKVRSYGFCPVGFYVPDWRDVHDGSILPGSKYWEKHDEWPDGTLGFVWGCYWGDDNGWKVQALDLSEISKGKVRRDDRFGYLYLDSDHSRPPSDFIRCTAGEGSSGPRVTFSVPMTFDVTTGKSIHRGYDEE